MIAVFAVGISLFGRPDVRAVHAETAYERVVRTKTLRCGYMIAPPFIAADPNTKKLSGMNVDYTEAMGKMLGLKITWTEVITGQQVEALRTNKLDALCAGEAPLVTALSVYLHYSEPLVFSPIQMYVRTNEMRFDGTMAQAMAKANDPSLTVSFMDSDLTQDFAQRLFPRAKTHELPQIADYPQVYLDVATGKADFVINDPFTAGAFMKNNPGKLRKVNLDKPFAVLPNTMSVLRGEEALADMLSQGIRNIRERNLEDSILAPYERDYPGAIYRVKELYRVPTALP